MATAKPYSTREDIVDTSFNPADMLVSSLTEDALRQSLASQKAASQQKRFATPIPLLTHPLERGNLLAVGVDRMGLLVQWEDSTEIFAWALLYKWNPTLWESVQACLQEQQWHCALSEAKRLMPNALHLVD
jgi:hypothetical protein